MPEPDDAPEEPAIDHDDDTQRRVSFFESSNVLDADLRDHAAWIEIEEADEAVCARVWEMFAKDSTARGFDARSARSKRASEALAARWAKDGTAEARRLAPLRTKIDNETREATTMKREDFAAAHAAYVKAHGEVPSAAALFAAMGRDAGTIANVRQTIKRVGLELAGARGPLAKTHRRLAPPPRAPKASLGVEGAPARSRPRGDEVLGMTPLIAGLSAERDAMVARVAAIDAAIEALRPAS